MTPDEIDALAGEYALGLLEPGRQAEVDERLAHDPAMAASVARWRERLIELDATASPAEPSPGVWADIERAIEAQLAPKLTAGQPPSPARRRLDGRRSPSRAAESAPRRPWAQAPFLRAAALTGAAASVALAVALGFALDAGRRQPQIIAVLLKPDARPGAVVQVFSDGSAYVAPLDDAQIPAGRTMQVWTLPDPATGPVSVGLLEDARSALLQTDSLGAPKPKQLYEITVEQAGGSPTGRPTGPILYKGYAEQPR